MDSLSRNAWSGTTRISVGEHPLQAPLRLGQRSLKMLQLVAVAEPDVVGEAEVVARDQQDAVLRTDLLDQIGGLHAVAVLHETDRPRLRRGPGGTVPQPRVPLLPPGVVGPEGAARSPQQLVAHPRLAAAPGQGGRRPRPAQAGA